MTFEEVNKHYPKATAKLIEFSKKVYREMFGKDLEFINQLNPEQEAVIGVAKGIWEKKDRVLYDFFDENKLLISLDIYSGDTFRSYIDDPDHWKGSETRNRSEAEREAFEEAMKQLENQE